jgi:redox-sensing transcriptional repressor
MADNVKGVPVPTIKRLPSYLQFLKGFRAQGREVVSCTHIAAELRSDPTQVRKDLEWTGIVGKPKVGYDTQELIAAIENFLGWNNLRDAFLVGAGSLGTALLGYERFKNHGLNIIAAFDIDPTKIGKNIHGKDVLDVGKLTELARRMHIHVGILTVPAEMAQEMANVLVEAGVIAIWNFAPVSINCPEHIIVENAHLSNSLAVLTNRLSQQTKKV